ncbi:hypothetical protein BDC45DRAFT_576627 [Circinella umbellata]|nr:hypothetical protein BDC45DRAFT_576627 [Circinella umbellata]
MPKRKSTTTLPTKNSAQSDSIPSSAAPSGGVLRRTMASQIIRNQQLNQSTSGSTNLRQPPSRSRHNERDILNEFPLVENLQNKPNRRKRRRIRGSTNLLARSNASIDMGMFKQKVAAYCFTENAFPNPEEARVACNRIIREITDLNDDQRDRQTDGALLTKFNQILGKRRTSLHSGVLRWLEKEYPNLNRYLPTHIDKANRIQICSYLLEENRYARNNYDAEGAFLYSDSIIDCICFTLLNPHGGHGRLSCCPHIISRQTICLITLMMKYRIAKGANDPDVEAGTNGSFFGDNTDWEDFYFDMLLPEGNLYKYIEWPRVEAFITEGVHKRIGGHRNGNTTKAFGNIASISTSIPNISSSVMHAINTTGNNKRAEQSESDEYEEGVREEDDSGEEDEYREQYQCETDLYMNNNNRYEEDSQFGEEYGYEQEDHYQKNVQFRRNDDDQDSTDEDDRYT